MKQPHREKSVQCDLLHVRETSGDMLCLATPGSPTQRSYRAVLEVFPINLALKAQEEQEAIIERFGALIRSLSFPLQVLVRNQRLDLLPTSGASSQGRRTRPRIPPLLMPWHAVWPNSCSRLPPSAPSSSVTCMSSSPPHLVRAERDDAEAFPPCPVPGECSASPRPRNRPGRNWRCAQRRLLNTWPPVASPAGACAMTTWRGFTTGASPPNAPSSVPCPIGCWLR